MEPLRLRWQKTWPDRPRDYVAKLADGQSVCRIYHSPATAAQGRGDWYWTCNGRYKGLSCSTAGYAATKNEAARFAEAEWFKMVERIDRDGCVG